MTAEALRDRTLKAAVARGHIGLASICERIEALGGIVDIESELGVGTRVKVVLPAEDANPCAGSSPGDGSLLLSGLPAVEALPAASTAPT